MNILALVALIPIALGPIPEEERTLTLSLCLGGEITIPLGEKDEDHNRGCHSQGCHAGACRQKIKPLRR